MRGKCKVKGSMVLSKVLVFLIVGFLICHFFGIAEDFSPNLVILYTGDSKGYIEPCG